MLMWARLGLHHQAAVDRDFFCAGGYESTSIIYLPTHPDANNQRPCRKSNSKLSSQGGKTGDINNSPT